MREKWREKVSSIAYFLLGCLCLVIYGKPICSIAINASYNGYKYLLAVYSVSFHCLMLSLGV